MDNKLLGPKHTGMRIPVSGILTRIIRGEKLDKGSRYMIEKLLEHLEETGRRFYSSDIKVIDEFLQLYCLDNNRPNKKGEG